MTKDVIVLSNEEINALVVAYQKDQTEMKFNAVYDAVFPYAEQLAYKAFHSSKHLGVPSYEFVQCARIAIFKAVEAIDFSKSVYFVSLVGQLVNWTIQDEIFKKFKKADNKFNRKAVHLDKPLLFDEGTIMDAIMDQLATEHDSVFDAVIAEADHEDQTDRLDLIMAHLVTDFSATASADDALLIKAWVSLILSDNIDNSVDFSRLVNKEIKTFFPDVSSSALRKKKERAEIRFNKFAHDLGYTSFKLSHF